MARDTFRSIRRVILPGLSGFGMAPEAWTIHAPINDEFRDLITRFVLAVTLPLENTDGRVLVADDMPILRNPLASGWLPDGLEDVERAWQDVLKQGEVIETASFVGQLSPHRLFHAHSERGAALANLFMALAHGQIIRKCDRQGCEALFAGPQSQAHNHYCSIKCATAVQQWKRRNPGR